MIEITITQPPAVTTDDGWTWVTPAQMPARRPRHTWSPPAGRQAAQTAQAQASPSADNAHARRLQRRNGNGWHA